MQTGSQQDGQKTTDSPSSNRVGLFFMAGLLSGTGWASPRDLALTTRHQIIPILGLTVTQQAKPVGVVAQVHLILIDREDAAGLHILFHTRPGRFSPLAQRAVQYAIKRAAKAAGLETASWTVQLIFPYRGLTLYGESLSAIVGLSVIALAKGDPLPQDRTLTRTITPEGQIGKVGGVPDKIQTAYGQHFQRVLIPEEPDPTDDDWHTPFLMQVSPVGTVSKAYVGLTGRPL